MDQLPNSPPCSSEVVFESAQRQKRRRSDSDMDIFLSVNLGETHKTDLAMNAPEEIALPQGSGCGPMVDEFTSFMEGHGSHESYTLLEELEAVIMSDPRIDEVMVPSTSIARSQPQHRF
jgi:hypothetical protein